MASINKRVMQIIKMTARRHCFSAQNGLSCATIIRNVSSGIRKYLLFWGCELRGQYNTIPCCCRCLLWDWSFFTVGFSLVFWTSCVSSMLESPFVVDMLSFRSSVISSFEISCSSLDCTFWFSFHLSIASVAFLRSSSFIASILALSSCSNWIKTPMHQ